MAYGGGAVTLTLDQQPKPWQRTLAECESVIERGKAAFVEVGEALAEVRDRRLYRQLGIGTFETYCRVRWGWTRDYGHKLLNAARVVRAIEGNVDHGLQPPRSEREARPLVALKDDPEAVRAAWAEAVATAPATGLTAAHVATVVAGRRPLAHRDAHADRQVRSHRDAHADRQVRSHRDAHADRNRALAEQVLEREARFLAGATPGAPPRDWYDRVAPIDALSYLHALPDGCVDLCVTSPPYWAKRVYSAGDADELGQEADPQTYVEALRRIVGEIGRVLTPTGWLFLVLGDTYASQPGQQRGKPERRRGISDTARRQSAGAPDGRRFDVPSKSLCLVPWRLVTALVQTDGWRLRNVIAWTKPNHLPANVFDRLTEAWEPVFALTRSAHPYFDREAGGPAGVVDVWPIAVGREPNGTADVGAHPAVFPSGLVRRCIGHACPPGGAVLDPFAGSGRVLEVAAEMGRRFLGCDLVDWSDADDECGQ
jgi:DNA modification methylase